MNLARVTSLLAALIFAQLAYAGHYHSIDEKHTETECVLCVHASFLDNAIDTATPFPPYVSVSDIPDTSGLTSPALFRYYSFNTRAPPLFF